MRPFVAHRRALSAAEIAKRRQAREALDNALRAPLTPGGAESDLAMLRELGRHCPRPVRIGRFRGAGP